MTKLRVSILIALMTAALLGIIVLQLFWMKNALEVRNELFDSSVKEALLETSKSIEKTADVMLIRHLTRPGYFAPPKGAPRMLRFNNQRHLADTSGMKRSGTMQGKNIETRIQVIATGSDSSSGQNIEIEMIALDSVITNMEASIDRNYAIWFDSSQHDSEPDSFIVNHQQDFVYRFNRRAERLKNVAGQMVFENWMMDKFRLPDTVFVQQTLAKALAERNIPIDFEYGILSKGTSMMKSGKADTLLLYNSNYVVSLFPNEIISRDEQLAVYFPERKNFVLKTLLGPSLLSLFFSILIMVVFGLSIYYIVNQKKISEMKSDFINNMTHEFKTPIATIQVATDTIVNPKVIGNEDQIRHFTQIIKKENLRMNQQVESILQIARLEKKEFDFKFEVVNLHELIEMAVQIISLQVENRGGQVETRFKAQNPLVTTDARHALNLLNNLLDNANKYSPESPQISVNTRNVENGVWVAVSDQGIGMNRAVLQKIFEKFYRETSGNIHNVKGFGLGLSYVKAIVEANNGEIKVQSEPGKGSTFEVFFPFTITKTEKLNDKEDIFCGR
jgi:two-component system, OmpR family, phosphate regulon sensor histidine kinase PhoR